MKHIPTARERTLIRDCAKRMAGLRGVIIEPGIRVHLKSGDVGLNIAALTGDTDTDDAINATDLHDYSTWLEFVRGFELTPEGVGIVDFYVTGMGRNGELEGNVTAFWRDGKLSKITGTCCGTMWKAD